MNRFATIFILIFFICCCARDRQTTLKRKFIGDWRTKTFGIELPFRATESAFYVPMERGYFDAESYSISEHDSITFYTFNDTLTLKMSFNESADTMRLVNKKFDAVFIRD